MCEKKSPARQYLFIEELSPHVIAEKATAASAHGWRLISVVQAPPEPGLPPVYQAFFERAAPGVEP